MDRVNRDGRQLLSKYDYILAGSMSGFISRAMVQPLDVLKIRFQVWLRYRFVIATFVM